MPTRIAKIASAAALYIVAVSPLDALAAESFQIIAGNQTLQRPSASSMATGSGSFVTPKTASPAMATPAIVEQPIREFDPDRKIRAVGPRFLPDPAEAINLRVPGQTNAR